MFSRHLGLTTSWDFFWIFFSSSFFSLFLRYFPGTNFKISYSCNSLCSKVPSWLTTFAPADALIMQEEAWNAFPKCKSGVPCHHDTLHDLFLLELTLMCCFLVLICMWMWMSLYSVMKVTISPINFPFPKRWWQIVLSMDKNILIGLHFCSAPIFPGFSWPLKLIIGLTTGSQKM